MPAGSGTATFPAPPTPRPTALPTWEEQVADYINRETGLCGYVSYKQERDHAGYSATFRWNGPVYVQVRFDLAYLPNEREVALRLCAAVKQATDDLDHPWRWYGQLVQCGIMTPNEARALSDI